MVKATIHDIKLFDNFLGIINKFVQQCQFILDTDGVKVYCKNPTNFSSARLLLKSNVITLNKNQKYDKVKKGQVIADGPSTDMGEMALGRNVTVAFMNFNGYNYEDAVILNEKLVRDDVYTSIHIEDYQMQCRETKLGPEEITRDIPNVGEDARKNLDENGIIRIGTEVKEGDILECYEMVEEARS